MNKLLRFTTLVFFTVILAVFMSATASALTTVAIESVEVTEGTESVRVPVMIKDNQGIISVLTKLTYDEALTLTSVETGEVISNSFCSNDAVDLASNPYTIYLSDSTSTEDITANGVLVYLNFDIDKSVSGPDELSITLHDGIAYNASVKRVTLAYSSGAVKILPGDYEVRFVDWDGTLIKSENVESGKAATAPEAPVRADSNGIGYVFTGWDKDFDNITSAIEVKAQYRAFVYGDVDGNGTTDATDNVIISRTLAKWQGYDASDIDMASCDVDKDGELTSSDNVIVSRYLAKWQGYLTLPYIA